MIEWVIAPLAIGALGFVPKGKLSDKRKIQKIFENMKIGVQERGNKELSYPKFYDKKQILEDEEKVLGTRYTFTFPLGLSAKAIQKIQSNGEVFSDGLNKPVEIEFDGMLHLNVYDKKLPTLINFKDVPIAKEWKLSLGRHYKGWIVHDFDAIPHMIVGGTTRFGKSVLLKTLVTQLILANPDDVEIFIVDLKGGLEFNRFSTLKQVKKVAKNAVEALLILREIQADMTGEIDEEGNKLDGGMQETFLKNGWTNVVESPFKTRKFVIVDEGAQLAPEKWMPKEMKNLLSECQYILSEIARIGGALSYRLIFTTQYPTADVLPRQIKMNADIKIAFRLGTGYASQVVIDEDGAEDLPTDIKGRALVKTHELREMQVPLLQNNEMWKLLEVYNESDIIEHFEEKETRKDYIDLG